MLYRARLIVELSLLLHAEGLIDASQGLELALGPGPGRVVTLHSVRMELEGQFVVGLSDFSGRCILLHAEDGVKAFPLLETGSQSLHVLLHSSIKSRRCNASCFWRERPLQRILGIHAVGLHEEEVRRLLVFEQGLALELLLFHLHHLLTQALDSLFRLLSLGHPNNLLPRWGSWRSI